LFDDNVGQPTFFGLTADIDIQIALEGANGRIRLSRRSKVIGWVTSKLQLFSGNEMYPKPAIKMVARR
jgi:hypothetical protein